MIALMNMFLSVRNEWHFEGNRCLLIYRETNMKSGEENRKVQCILDREKSPWNACLGLWSVSILTNGCSFQKVQVMFIHFISLMSARSVGHDKMCLVDCDKEQ